MITMNTFVSIKKLNLFYKPSFIYLLSKSKINFTIVFIFLITSCSNNLNYNAKDVNLKKIDYKNGNKSHSCISLYFPSEVFFENPIYLKKEDIKKIYFPNSNNILEIINTIKNIKKYLPKSILNIILIYISGFEKYTEEIFNSLANKNKDLKILYTKIYNKEFKNKIIKLDDTFYILITNNDLKYKPCYDEMMKYRPFKSGFCENRRYGKDLACLNYNCYQYEEYDMNNDEKKILVTYRNNNNYLVKLHNTKHKGNNHIIYKYTKKNDNDNDNDNENNNEFNCINFHVLSKKEEEKIKNSIPDCWSYKDCLHTKIFEKKICCFQFIWKGLFFEKKEKAMYENKPGEFHEADDGVYLHIEEVKSIHILYDFKTENSFLNCLKKIKNYSLFLGFGKTK